MAPVHLEFAQNRAFWNTDEGRERVRAAVAKRVTYEPNEWQIRLPAATLAGQDVLLILKTGGGKTSLVSHSAFVDPDGITIMVSPLNLLEENQVESFHKQGLRAVAINADALVEAQSLGRDLWREAREGLHQIILTSPEMLQSSPFGKVIDCREFRRLLARFVVDEAHTILEWSDSLRPAYAILSDMRERLPEHVTFMAMTATLPPGEATDTVFRTLGFRHERTIIERRDCERTDMDIFIRELQHGIDAASTFPDLDWLVPEDVAAAKDIPKTLVYCDQIDLTHRVARYLRTLLPAHLRPAASTLIITVTSLSCRLCKAAALATLQQQGEQRTCGVHVATDVLSMGVDVSDIKRVICCGTPASLALMLQRIGRVARAHGIRGAAYIYVRKSDMKWARAEAERLSQGDTEPAGRGRGRGRGSRGRGRGRGRGKAKSAPASTRAGREGKCPLLDRLLVAAVNGTCINLENNIIMGNPNTDPAYLCGACGSCLGDDVPEPRTAPEEPPDDAGGGLAATALADAVDALSSLSDLAADIWLAETVPRTSSSRVFLSQMWKERIVGRLDALDNDDAVRTLMRGWKHWDEFGSRLTAGILAGRKGWQAGIAANRKRRLAKQRGAKAKRARADDHEDDARLVRRAKRDAAREAEEERQESEESGSDTEEEEQQDGASATSTAHAPDRPTRRGTKRKTAEALPPVRKRFADAVEPRLGEQEEASTGRTRRRILYDISNV